MRNKLKPLYLVWKSILNLEIVKLKLEFVLSHMAGVAQRTQTSISYKAPRLIL